MKHDDIGWFASGGDIARSGPYTSQMEAYNALRLTESAQRQQRETHGTDSPYPRDLLVWPEPAMEDQHKVCGAGRPLARY